MPSATDEEIDAQIERIRSQFAELEVVERAADDGDYVTIDIEGTPGRRGPRGPHRRRLPLRGRHRRHRPRARRAAPRRHGRRQPRVRRRAPDDSEETPEEPLHFEVTVKEVKDKVLPDLDDEFAAEASEFDTLAELRDDLATRLTQVKRAQAQMAAAREGRRGPRRAGRHDELPEPLVAQEMNERLQDMAMRLQAQGLSLEQWLQFSGTETEQFLAELRETAERSAKVDLALRAVAEAEAIEALEEDLEEEFAAVAERVERGRRHGARAARPRPVTSPRYAPTSRSARRSSGSPRPSRSSTRTATPSPSPSSPSSRSTRTTDEITDDDTRPTTPPRPTEASTPSEEGESE